MNRVSRRRLARFAANQLLAGVNTSLLARQLASWLINEKRLSELDMLIGDISYQLESRGALAIAQVRSAHEFASDLRHQLKQALTSTLKVSEVQLKETVDPSLLGGFTLETTTTSWDLSVKRALMDIRKVV